MSWNLSVCVCVGPDFPLTVLPSVLLCFNLVSDIYIHCAAVQPEANEHTELQALKLQHALSFVFVSPSVDCTAEVHSHHKMMFLGNNRNTV